ncbi:MAG: TetR/AcrR family transcriptional regulator [Gammaproteobacteria bacterium]
MRQETDTYQRILESARDLMYASGCADSGVAAICEKAQVQKGTFYHYFKSKQELTLSVIDAFYSDMKESVLDKAFDPSLPPLTRLSRFIDMIIDNQISIYEKTGHVLGCPFGNLASELSTQDETIRIKLNGLFMDFKQLIRGTLQDAVDAGELALTDVDLKAEAFLAYFEGCMLIAKTRNDPTILQRLLPTALDFQSYSASA